VAICQTFFGKFQEYPPAQMEQLKVALNNFLKACRQALKKHETLIDHDMLEFHEELTQGYQDVKTQMKTHMKAYSATVKKRSKLPSAN
jgi:hypothetical protein